MTQKNEQPERGAAEVEALPADLNLLLEEIEKEPVPDKLLALAVKLQEALVERRSREDAAKTARESLPRRETVRQPQ